jgi:hypothetical protein
MAKPKKAPPRPLPPPKPATVTVPRRRPHERLHQRPRSDSHVVPAEPTAVAAPMVQELVARPRSPSARSLQVLAYLLAVGLLAFGFVDLRHPVLGQDGAPTDSAEDMPELAFYPPVALPADSSYVATVVHASGDLRVTHWIYSKIPLSSISLTAPEPGGLQSGRVVATEVEVAADGRVVPGAGAVDTMSQSYQVFGASTVYVTYLLAGAVERSASAEGRALARVTSLDVSYASTGGTSTRSVEGADILNMACTRRADPDATPEPCGTPEPGRWQVELSGDDRDDRVMVQMNLG